MSYRTQRSEDPVSPNPVSPNKDLAAWYANRRSSCQRRLFGCQFSKL